MPLHRRSQKVGLSNISVSLARLHFVDCGAKSAGKPITCVENFCKMSCIILNVFQM